MKKRDFLTFFSILVLSTQVMAQTSPIIGYDKVSWGSSVADVRRAYNIEDDVVIETSSNDGNIQILTESNVSEAIKERNFYFNNNKLYRVYVDYKDTSDNTAKNLLSVLENRFGRQTDYDIETGTKYLMFQQLNYKTETITFGRYSPDLIVELIHTVFYAGYEKDSNNLLGQNQLWVRYTWKSFRDEYEASKLGL